jgi:predicted nucleic acid-binding protein
VDRRIIADTSGIIAFLDKDDQYHSLAVNIVKNYQIFIPVTVLPEVDYLATKYLGERVARAFLKDLKATNPSSITNFRNLSLASVSLQTG